MPLRHYIFSERAKRGFTLFELIMVMTIMVILASITVVAYQRIQQRAKETLLKQNLQTMRKLIDQYAADKEELPQSLDDLVESGYMHDVPVDPITGEADWEIEFGDDTVSVDQGQGMVDVHSKAQEVGSDGKAYSEY